MRRIDAEFLGTVPYTEAVALQEKIRESIRRGDGSERLLLLEHPHVFTVGRNADRADVRADATWLVERQVEIAECNRGGQVTYHGPGQLVGYPIVDLNPDRRDLRRYIHDLQRVLVATLGELSIDAEARVDAGEIGVWVDAAKIASLGVHVSRWITTHGFALNVSTDLSLFDGIVACGLPNVRMTSVERLLGQAPPIETVARIAARRFGEVLEREVVWGASQSTL